MRIVHDRREEVDRLHERRFGVEREDGGIVGRSGSDQDARIANLRQFAQDLREVFRVELAGSPGAVTPRCQPHPFHVVPFATCAASHRDARPC
jgi:hypothetical protein